MPLPKLSPPRLRDSHNSAATDVSLLEAEIRSSFMQMVVNTLGGERTSSFSQDDKELGFAFGEKAPSEESALPKGSVIGGRFTVQKPLGRGGFGTVYLAHDESLDRDVAIKVPHEKLRSDPQFSSQCLKEARLAAKLRHPSIVTIFDISEDQGRIAYIVQEYVQGATLYELIAKQRFSIKQTIVIVMKVAEAIAFAHARGVYHRDLKPANLIVDETGGIRVLDFGLAVDEEMQRGARGQVAGTLAYMSPEQIEGRTHHLDGRTDIWSLGVIFYELLTGRRPFRGTTVEITDQVTHREAAPPRQFLPSIPKPVEACCLNCLAKSIPDRYGTAIDLVEDLKSILETEELPDEAPGAPLTAFVAHDTKKLARDTTKEIPQQKDWRWERWRIGGVAAVIGILLLVPVAGFLLSNNWNNSPKKDLDQREPEESTPPSATQSPSRNMDDSVDRIIISTAQKLIVPPADSSVVLGGEDVALSSQSECAIMFEPENHALSFEIEFDIHQADWHGMTGLLFGIRKSQATPDDYVAQMVEIRRVPDDPTAFDLTYSQVVLNTSRHRIDEYIELSGPIRIAYELSGKERVGLAIKNGFLDRVWVGEVTNSKIANVSDSQIASATGTLHRHKLTTIRSTGRIGVLVSKSSLSVLDAEQRELIP